MEMTRFLWLQAPKNRLRRGLFGDAHAGLAAETTGERHEDEDAGALPVLHGAGLQLVRRARREVGHRRPFEGFSPRNSRRFVRFRP